MDTQEIIFENNSAVSLGVNFNDRHQSFDVFEKENPTISMNNLSGSLKINGVKVILKDSEDVTVSGNLEDDGSLYVEHNFFKMGFIWIWEFVKTKDELILLARIKALDETIVVSDIQIICADSDLHPIIQMGDSAEDVRFFRWESWNMGVDSMASNGGKHISSNLCHLYHPKSKRSILCGFITLDRMRGQHNLVYNSDFGIIKYEANCLFGKYKLSKDKELISETLSISIHDDPYSALEFWADKVNSKYKPTFKDLPPVGWIGGWIDGFSEREDTFEDIVMRNAKAIRTRLRGFDVDYIWTSQNYMKDYIPGNWLNHSLKDIPSGLPKYFKNLKKLNFIPGLWVSPFWFLGEAEGMFERCKDFLLRDNEGNPICDIGAWGGDYDDEFSQSNMHKYYLDGTNPKAIEFIKSVFEYFTSIGVGYYMLDFLAILDNSKPYDESILPLESARKMMQSIRNSVGPDTHMQTAVSSIPGYVNIISAARVGRDYGEGRPLQGGPLSDIRNATNQLHDDHYANPYYLLQNAAASYFTHRKLYINDFNLLTVDKPIPLELARISATVFGISAGSPLMMGDDYVRMNEERLRMVKCCLPRTQDMAKPVDLFDNIQPDNYCRTLKLDIDKKWGNWQVISVFNLDETPYQYRLDFAKLGLDPDGSYRIWEFWSEEYCGTYTKHFDTYIHPNTCKVFRISKAENHPWLLSTDMHIQQGNVEVVDLKWDSKEMSLSGTVTRPVDEKSNLFLLMPRKFLVINHEGLGLMKELIDMNVIIQMPIHFESDIYKFKLYFESWTPKQIVRKHFYPYETEKEWLDYKEEHRKAGDTRVIE